MESINPQLTALAARIDALTLRERALVLLAIVAVLFAGWDFFVNSSLQKERKQFLQTLTEADARLDALDRATEEILSRDRTDPNLDLRARLESLHGELDVLKARKQKLARSFMAPELMAALLQNVLKSNGSLRLVALETAPAKPLFQAGAGENDPAGEMPTIYRHELTIEFEGAYFDLLAYLRELERQPLFWDSIGYRVKGYPQASVRLKLYTLSFEREWLGV